VLKAVAAFARKNQHYTKS